jgi:uncharacterized protein
MRRALKSIALAIGVLLWFSHQAAADPLVINEFVANHTGSDTNEYIELFGDPLTSFLGYAVLQIEGDGAVAGVVDSTHFTSGFSTDANGFIVTSFMNNVLENGTMTLLLVSGYTGVTVGTDLDSNNDGILDAILPWSLIVDSVAVTDGGLTDRVYSSSVLPALAPGFAVGGASRIPNGLDTDSASDWVQNDFLGYGLPGFSTTRAVGFADNTPGTFNHVPEPATSTLVGCGILSAFLAGRRRRTSHRQ